MLKSNIPPAEAESQKFYASFSTFRHLVAIDSELQSRYLSENLEDICASADKTNSSILTSSAPLPLQSRIKALEAWRAKTVRDQVFPNSELSRQFRDTGRNPEMSRAFESGSMSLSEWFSVVEKDSFDERTARIAARREWKARLRSMLRALVQDAHELPADRYEARWMVMLSTGETTFWRYERNARKYGIESGDPFQLAAFDLTRSKLMSPAGNWSLSTPGDLDESELFHKPALGMTAAEVEDLDSPEGIEEETTDEE